MNGIDIDDGDFEDFRARNLSSRQQRPVTGRTFMKLKTGDETSDINNASTTTDHSSYFQQQTSQDNSRVASQNNLLQFSERNSVNSLHSRPRTAAASVVSTSRPLSSKAPKLPNTAGRYKGLSYDTIRAYEMEDIYNGETRGEESWVDEFSKSPSQPAKSRPNTSKSIQFNVTAATGNRVKSAATTAKSSCRPGTTASSRSFVVAKLLHSRKGSATSNSSAKAILPEDERDYDCIQVDTKRLFEGLNATFKIKEEVVQGKLSKLPQKRMKRPDYSEIVGSSPLINSSPGSRDQPRPSTIVQNLLLVNDGASNNKNRLSVMNTSASHIKRRSIAGGLVASASSSRRIGGSVSGEHHHQFIGNSRPSSAGKFRGSGTLSGNSTDDDDSGDEASTSKKRPGTSKNPTSKNLKPLLDRKDLMKFVKSCILNEESHHVLETLSGGHTSQTPSRPGTSKSTASSYVYHPRPYTAPIKPDPKKFMKRWVQSQGPKLRIQSAAMMREEAIDEKRELAPTIPNLKREGPPSKFEVLMGECFLLKQPRCFVPLALADFRHIKELNLFEDSKTKSEFTVKDFIKEYLHTIAKVQMRETGKLQKAGFINKHFRRSSSTVALNPGRSTVATPSQEMLKFLPPPMDENNDKHQQRRISHAQHPGAGTRRRTAIDMGTSVENNKHTLTTYALRKNGFDRNKVDIQLIFELMRVSRVEVEDRDRRWKLEMQPSVSQS